jgi:hypothetical protein
MAAAATEVVRGGAIHAALLAKLGTCVRCRRTDTAADRGPRRAPGSHCQHRCYQQNDSHQTGVPQSFPRPGGVTTRRSSSARASAERTGSNKKPRAGGSRPRSGSMANLHGGATVEETLRALRAPPPSATLPELHQLQRAALKYAAAVSDMMSTLELRASSASLAAWITGPASVRKARPPLCRRSLLLLPPLLPHSWACTLLRVG